MSTRSECKKLSSSYIFSSKDSSISSIQFSKASNEASIERNEVIKTNPDVFLCKRFAKSPFETEVTEKKYNYARKLQNKKDYGVDFCGKCERLMKIIGDLEGKQNSAQQKLFQTEKHLKQYDDLLKIKENRLVEQENELKAESESVKRENFKLLELKDWIEEEKEKVFQETELLINEKNDLESQFEELARKKLDLQDLIEEFEEKKAENQIFLDGKQNFSLDVQENLLISRDCEIKRLLEESYVWKIEHDDKSQLEFSRLEGKEGKIRKKKQELKKYEKSLAQAKEKMREDQKIQIEKLVNQSNSLKFNEKKLEIEKKKIAEAWTALNLEKESFKQEKILQNAHEASTSHHIHSLSEVKSSFQKGFSKIQQSESSKSVLKSHQTEDFTFKASPETSEKLLSLKDSLAESKDQIKFLESKCENLEKDLKKAQKKNKKFSDTISNQNSQIAELESELAKNSSEKSSPRRPNLTIITAKNSLNPEKSIENPAKKFEKALNEQISVLKQSEVFLKLKVAELENVINVDGGKLKKELEIAIKRNNYLEGVCKELEGKIETLNLENVELLNQCEEIKLEKEKFRKFSESLHERIIEIDTSPLSSASRASNRGEFKEICELQKELQGKLVELVEREEKIAKVEGNLEKERISLVKAADYIKNINEELCEQRGNLSEQLENISKERGKLMNLYKIHDQKVEMLSTKEEELLILKQKLNEREKLLSQKQDLSPSRISIEISE